MSTLFSHFYSKINQNSPLENNFTGVLDAIAVKPKMLYFRGKMPENMMDGSLTTRPKCVAIVGTRHCTKYGEGSAGDANRSDLSAGARGTGARDRGKGRDDYV